MSNSSVAAQLLLSARRRLGIRQAELARRAGIPRSVVNTYERGHRQPGVDGLAVLLAAAGLELRLGPRVTMPDPTRAARILADVLALSEVLPTRRRGALRYPPFASRLK